MTIHERSPGLSNPALERMRSGGVALGMVVRLGRSPDIAWVARAAGHDFLFIDLQHAAFSLETVSAIAHAARGCGVSPFARVRGARDPNIGVLLDSGVTGIVIPDVGTASDARDAVNACKFAPIGRRSLSSPHSSLDFRPLSAADSMRTLNEGTLVACMVETVAGVENAADIAAVDGVDVVLVGCTDLLIDMGKPGSTQDPGLDAAIQQVVVATRASGKFAGVGGIRDIDQLAHLVGDGVQFATAHTDVALLVEEASRRIQVLRGKPLNPST